jgi:hypothetical protein
MIIRVVAFLEILDKAPKCKATRNPGQKESSIGSVGSCLPCVGGCYDTQDSVFELRRKAERALAMLHIEAKAAWDAGATEVWVSTRPERQLGEESVRHPQPGHAPG